MVNKPYDGKFIIMTRKFEEQEIRDAIASSSSMLEAATKVMIPHMTFKRIAQRLGLYKANQGRKGKPGLRGAAVAKAVPLEKYLKQGTSIAGQKLKRRLIEAGLKKDECEICKQPPIWNGQKLVLQLDHKNGVNTDNRLENVRIVCGHCHSQTPTFAGRNVGRKYAEL